MVELFENEVKNFDRQSSKGNQQKWKKDGIWYKADYTGYEGLVEYIISKLLLKSTLSENEFVLYETEILKYKRAQLLGVSSKDFLENDWQIITLERLYKTKYNRSLMSDVWKINGTKDRLQFLIGQIENIIRVENFGQYISKIITIDAIFLNEDRHLHNIAILMNSKGEAKLCPIFDNGAGLLSDITVDYPMNEDVYSLMKEVKAKTITENFDDALDAAETLFGEQIHFSFNQNDVIQILNNDNVYSSEYKNRVMDIIFEQMKKYQYLFI